MAKKVSPAPSKLKSKISKPQSLRVLMVEDSEADALLTIRALKKGGYNPVYERVETAAAMKKAFKEKQWDIILCDYKLPKFNATSAIVILKETNIDIPLIIVSGSIGEETAVECMRLGAKDYIMKGNLSRLCSAVARELEEAKARNKQKQAEKALKVSEEKYRLVVENAKEAIIIIQDGNVVFFNRAAIDMIGYSGDISAAKPFTDFIHPDDRNMVADHYIKRMKGEEVQSDYSFRILSEDGTIKSVEFNAAVIQWKEKPAILIFLNDITEHKQAESQREATLEALRQSEEKYRTILDEMEDVYLEVDLAGNFTFFNDAIFHHVGYSREELIGTSFRSQVAKEDIQTLYNAFGKIYSTGKPERSIFYKFVHKDGTMISVEAAVFPLYNQKGEIVGFRGIAIDITKRKQSEEALRDSEKYFKEITENSSDIIIIADKNGDIKYCSRSAERLIGYKPEDLIGRNVIKLIHPDDVERAVSDFGKAILLKDTAIPNAFRILHKDGSERYFEGLGKNLLDNPAVAGFIMNVHDITERKQAEEKIRQSEERYRTILDEMEDAYFEVDIAGNYTFVNDACCRHLGYSREELIGTTFRDQMAKEEIAGVYKAFSNIYTTGKPEKVILYKVLRKDGTSGLTEMAVFPLQNQKGETIGFRGIARNVTERKQMEEALRQSEEKYRTIIESIHDGYFEVDLAGNFTFFNESMRKIHGYPKEEFMGMNHRQCVDKQNAKKIFEVFNKVYKTGETGSILDYELIRKDGTKRRAEIAVSLKEDSSGNPIGFRGTSRDVTERKLAEEAVRQNEEKYRNILENIEDGYFEVDLTGNFTFFNDSMCRILGYPQEEMMGMNNRQFTDKENAKKLFKTFNAVYKTGKPAQEFDWQIIRKDGIKRYIETSISLRKNSSDQPIGFRGIIRDITERKLAEVELQKSEDRYRTFVENASDIVFTTSEFGYYTFVNLVTRRITGYSEEELIGKHYKMLVRPDKFKELITFLVNQYEKRIPNTYYEFPIIAKDGHEVWLGQNVQLIMEDDHVKGFQAIARDITERKRAEEGVLREKHFSDAVIDSLPGIFYLIDKKGHFARLNKNMVDVTGYSAQELLSFGATDVIKEEHKNLIKSKIEEAFNNGSAVAEASILTKEGREIPYYFTAVSTTLGGDIFIAGTGMDISERKQAEEERKQSFERLRKALGATVQSISMIVEMKDPYTAGHQQRVSDLARSIATEMGLSADQRDFIRTASAIHDIGKIALPTEILSKPTKLTNLEFSLIKTHSQSGYDILKDIDFPWPVADVVLQHHERMNGSGYPQGLKGDDIILEARIMAVADVVEAIASHRPYRASLGIDFALEEISGNKGILYDADAVDACLKLFREKNYTLVSKSA